MVIDITGPLSEIIWLGSPSLENRDHNTSTVFSAVVLLFIFTTSGHLVAASITISHVDPSYSPPKSTWRCLQGPVGFSHARTGALIDSREFSRQAIHLLTCSSIFSSVFCHHTCNLARDFILTIHVAYYLLYIALEELAQ